MPRNYIQMSESANNSIQEISVVDVYDLASDIALWARNGKFFQKLFF